MKVRFTKKGSTVYAVILGEPEGKTVVLRDVQPKDGTKVSLVGVGEALKWKQSGEDVAIEMPGGALPSKYAVTVKMEGIE